MEKFSLKDKKKKKENQVTWCELLHCLNSEHLELNDNWKILDLLSNKPSLNLIAYYVQKAISESEFYAQKIYNDYISYQEAHKNNEELSFKSYITVTYPQNIFNTYFKKYDLKKALIRNAKIYKKHIWITNGLDDIELIEFTLKHLFSETKSDLNERHLLNQKNTIMDWDILHWCWVWALDWILNEWLKSSLLIPEKIMLMWSNLNLWDVSFGRYHKNGNFYKSYKESVSAKYWASNKALDQNNWYTQRFDKKEVSTNLITVVFDSSTIDLPWYKYGNEERIFFWIPRKHIKSILVDWSNKMLVEKLQEKIKWIPFHINLINVSDWLEILD